MVLKSLKYDVKSRGHVIIKSKLWEGPIWGLIFFPRAGTVWASKHTAAGSLADSITLFKIFIWWWKYRSGNLGDCDNESKYKLNSRGGKQVKYRISDLASRLQSDEESDGLTLRILMGTYQSIGLILFVHQCSSAAPFCHLYVRGCIPVSGSPRDGGDTFWPRLVLFIWWIRAAAVVWLAIRAAPTQQQNYIYKKVGTNIYGFISH